MRTSLRLLSKLTVLSLVLSGVGCTQTNSEQSQATSEQPQIETVSADEFPVVTSYSVLCDIAEQLAQTTVDLTCLIDAGQDPHTYSPTPADRRAIEDAGLVLYGGYGFEPEIIQMVEATNTSTPKVAVSEVAVSNPLLGEAHDHHAEGEVHAEETHAEDEAHDHHTEGEVHSEEAHTKGEAYAENEMVSDPHIWHDAKNGIAMVKIVQAQLSELSPENAELYEANAETLITQLEQLDTWIQTQIDTVPDSNRTLITTHKALGYYADAYGLEIEPALDSFSTEVRPSAADIKALTEVVETKSVPSIFVESTSNPGLIEAVSRETDIVVSQDPIYADGLGEASTPAASYQGMLITNTCTIVSGLGGTCNQNNAQALLPTQ